MGIEVSDLKAEATGRWTEILVTVARINRDVLDGKEHPCPKCGGNTRFRLLDVAVGAVRCSHCFAEKCGDGIAAVMWMTDCAFAEALEKIANYVGMTVSTNGQSTDVIEAVCNAKRMPIEAFRKFGVALADGKRGKVARVDVYDESGAVHSHFDLTPGSKGYFRKGKGSAGMFLPGRRPEPGESWMLVEGVKDAAALVGLGLNAAGLPNSMMPVKYAELFRGCKLCIVPDLDKVGEEGALKTAARVTGIAADVRIARLPGELVTSKGDDVRDVINKHGASAVQESIASAKAFAVDTSGDRDRLLNPVEATEAGTAREFIRQFGSQVRYVADWNRWLVWDDKRWQVDRACRIDALAKQTMHGLYAEAVFCCTGEGRAGDEFYQKLLTKLIGFVKQSNKAKGVVDMLKLARSEHGIPLRPDELDADGYLFNVQNGTIDIRGQRLREATRADLITKIANVEFDSDADCPTWLRFLKRILPDHDVRVFVRRAAGLSFIGQQLEHILLICHGTGANGKSTLLTLLTKLFGDYGHSAPTGMFLQQKHDQHPTDMADLFGKRLVVALEGDEAKRLSEAKVKSLTGGDPITARRMRQDFFTFQPTHTTWMACNHKPIIRGTDEGIWRRVMLIPFNEFIEPEERDERLLEKLEAEMSGILNWCMIGLTEYQSDGLRPPKAVVAATDAYRQSQDTLGQFLDECCERSVETDTPCQDIYGSYKAWCERENLRAISNKAFSPAIEDRGFRKRKTNRCNVFEGITLKKVEGGGGSSG